MLPANLLEQAEFVFNLFPPTGRTGIFDVLPVGEIDELLNALRSKDFSEVEVRFSLGLQSTYYPICFISKFIIDEFGSILTQFNPMKEWIVVIRNPSFEIDLVTSLNKISIESIRHNNYLICLVENKKIHDVLLIIWQNPLDEVVMLQAKEKDTFSRTVLLLENMDSQHYLDILSDVEMIAAKTSDGFALSLITKNIFIPMVSNSTDIINKKFTHKCKMLSDRLSKIAENYIIELENLVLIHAKKWVKQNGFSQEIQIQKLLLAGVSQASSQVLETLVKVEFVDHEEWLLMEVLHNGGEPRLLNVKHCETIHWRTSRTNKP